MSIRPQTRTYEQWLQGPSGARSTLQTEYNSVNAQVYENGTLGPRPGWKIWTNSGLNFVEATDDLLNILWRRDASDNQELILVYFDGTAGRVGEKGTFSGSTITWTTETVLTNTISNSHLELPNRPGTLGNLMNVWHDRVQTVILGGAIYTDYPTGQTIPNTTNGYPGGATLYRDRAYYWGFATHPGRLYYSNAGDYTTVGAAASFDVAADATLGAYGVVGCYTIKNSLVIIRRDGTWMVLTGTTPDTGTLKEFSLDDAPSMTTGVIIDDTLWTLNNSGRGVISATPSYVDSESLSYLSLLRLPASTFDLPSAVFVPEGAVGDDITRSMYLPARTDSAVLTHPIVALERVNESWSFSSWPLSDTIHKLRQSPGDINQMWTAAESGSAGNLRVYSRNNTLNRPAKTSADAYSVGLTSEDGTASGSAMVIELGEITPSDDNIARPTKVVLEIDYWEGAAYDAVSLTVDCTVAGIDDDTPEVAATQVVVNTSTWDDGERARRRVSVPLEHQAWGSSIQVTLGGDGWALRRAVVYYDEMDDVR